MNENHMFFNAILKFFRDCSEHYLDSIRKQIPEFPKEYVYPTGNPIRPVLPVQITTNKVMVVGVFPKTVIIDYYTENQR